MLIDIFFLIVLAMAVVRGFRRGLVVAIFSLIGLIIGLAAALKLSTVAAAYLGEAVNVAARWLPFIAFALVFILAVFLVRLGALAVEKAMELVLLGWLNKLGGIILFVVLYTTIFSVVLFYAEKMHLLSEATIANSVTYSHLAPWGPKTIDAIGRIIPFFSNMFHDLSNFFEGIGQKENV